MLDDVNQLMEHYRKAYARPFWDEDYLDSKRYASKFIADGTYPTVKLDQGIIQGIVQGVIAALTSRLVLGPLRPNEGLLWPELLTRMEEADQEMVSRWRSSRSDLDNAVLPEGEYLKPPASEEAIAATEERIGMRLEPTLRDFYLYSNGAANPGPFFVRPEILPVEEIKFAVYLSFIVLPF